MTKRIKVILEPGEVLPRIYQAECDLIRAVLLGLEAAKELQTARADLKSIGRNAPGRSFIFRKCLVPTPSTGWTDGAQPDMVYDNLHNALSVISQRIAEGDAPPAKLHQAKNERVHDWYIQPWLMYVSKKDAERAEANERNLQTLSHTHTSASAKPRLKR